MSTSQVAAAFREYVPGDVSAYDVEGDLTTLEYCFVQLDTSRARCVAAWTSGVPVGVLVNKPIEDGTVTAFSTVAMVQTKGKALVKAGTGGIAVGDLVKLAAGGVAVKATPTAGDIIVGQCEYAAADTKIGTVRLFTAFYAAP
jgi:hypothetical protein